jgi:hypothetical protein
MNGPGWVYRAGGGISSGTTSLSIALAATPAVNDILILIFSHKGAGWGVVPAGWTLIDQQLAGTTRGEIYWRRATASETTPVVITGLATTARGTIVHYSGGLASGDIVDAQSTYTFTGSGVHSATGDKRASSITPTADQSLLLCFLFSDTADGSTRVGTAYQPEDTYDITTRYMVERCAATSTTVMRLGLYEIIKVVPCPTGDVWSDQPSTFPSGKISTGIFVALKPEPSASGSGTRYYLSAKYPLARQFGPTAGVWDSGLYLGPAGWMAHMMTWRLSRSTTDAGRAVFQNERFGVNAPGGAVNTTKDVLYARWMTPPLDAQTISGTFDLVLGANVSKQGLAGVTVGAVLKVHIYITIGQTPEVRATLLDRYVDATALNSVGTNITFASAQTLASAACLAGDSVMVELGARVTFTGTMPVPTRPVSEYATLTIQRGASLPAGRIATLECAAVGCPDATPGGFGVPSVQASYLQFSQAFVEQAPAGVIPTNITAAAATVITSLPYTATLDTSRAASPDRKVWFRWTADVSGRIFAHTFGTHYMADLVVYKSISPQTGVPFPELIEARARFFIDSTADLVIDAVSGTTYWIAAFVSPNVAATETAPAAGATLTFTLRRYIAPANNDVIFASNAFLIRYTGAGVLADISGQFFQIQVLALAIDYTHRPLINEQDGVTVDTSDRLMVGRYGLNQVYIIPIAGFGRGRPKDGGGTFTDAWVDYFDNPWHYNGSFVSAPHPGQLVASVAMNAAGRLVVSHYGNGYTRLIGQVSSGRPTYQDVLSTLNTADLLLVDGADADHQPGSFNPPAVRAQQSPTLDAGGINYIEFAQDGTTLYYTSDGSYVPMGGQILKRWDTVAGLQLPDLATIPAGPGPVPGLKGIFPLPLTPTTPAGGFLVCNGAEVVRLDAAGVVVQHYAPAGAFTLTDVEIDSEGETFWTVDEHTATLYKYDLLSGDLLLTIPTGAGGDEIRALVIYRTEAFPVIPPIIPPPSCVHACLVTDPAIAGGGQGCRAPLTPETGGGQGCQAPAPPDVECT